MVLLLFAPPALCYHMCILFGGLYCDCEHEVSDNLFREDVFQCLLKGEQIANELYQREQLISDAIRCSKGTPDYNHQAMHRASDEAMDKSRKNYGLLMAAKVLQNQMSDKQSWNGGEGSLPADFLEELCEDVASQQDHHLGSCIWSPPEEYFEILRYRMTPNTFSEFLNAHGFPTVNMPSACVPGSQVQCNEDDIYRTMDGSCNNLYAPTWGRAGTAMERLLQAKYEDGVYAPRLSVTGLPLPSARLISNVLFKDKPIFHTKASQIFGAFGQLIGHDFSSIVITQTAAGGITCCAPDGSDIIPQELRHQSCYPIRIPEDDPFYSQFHQRCMNFVRTVTTPRGDCTLGPAEQLNAVTSYLDGSTIYGSSHQASLRLRSFYFGQLIYELKYDRVFPINDPNNTRCDKKDPSEACYLTGDLRANQNPPLTLLHTIFLREHNLIAEQLAKVNPHWDDERLYQETRSIVISIMQKITYYDWLPNLIDVEYLVEHHIVNVNPGHAYDYNPQVNAATLNEFTSSAYRILHSIINGVLSLLSEERFEYASVPLREYNNRPSALLEQDANFEGLLLGLTTLPAMAADEHFTSEVTQVLFSGARPFGIDLESFDIQRGRDHGLKSYIYYRELCGFPKVNSFDDLLDTIAPKRVQLLSELYKDVRDIDLFVGASLENLVAGSLLGPTNQCIIGEQFYRWRVGDRYFFESDSNPNRLTDFQLHEVLKITLARVFCDTTDISFIQPDVFQLINHRNPLLHCDEIPRIDFRAWQEAN